MKNLYLYLMAITALMFIIVTVNVLTMSQVRQNEMMERMPDFLSEYNNLLFRGILIYLYPLRITIREIAVTIQNIPILVTFVAALVFIVIATTPKTTTVPFPNFPAPAPSHGYNLRAKRQKNFISN